MNEPAPDRERRIEEVFQYALKRVEAEGFGYAESEIGFMRTMIDVAMSGAPIREQPTLLPSRFVRTGMWANLLPLFLTFIQEWGELYPNEVPDFPIDPAEWED
jgi:hypothetical protein